MQYLSWFCDEEFQKGTLLLWGVCREITRLLESRGGRVAVRPRPTYSGASRNQTALWDKLRSEGWTWRKGTGLTDNFWYLRPGVKGRITDLEHNVDYFGVEDLWVYADAHDLWPTGVVVAAPPARKKKKKAKAAPPSSDDDEPPKPREKKRGRAPELVSVAAESQDLRADLLEDDWELVLPPLAIQRVRPEVTELWKRPGVGGRNLVLGYNCFATAREAAAQKDYVIPMSQVRAEAARWGWTDLAAALAAGTLDDDAARFEYAKLKFEQENAVRASEKRPRRGEK